MPTVLYRWVDNRGRIPGWVRVLWPWAHWCHEADDALMDDADCQCVAGRSKRWWETFGSKRA